MSSGALDVLDHYRRDAGLSHADLWLRYFELGGMFTGLQLEAILYGALLGREIVIDLFCECV